MKGGVCKRHGARVIRKTCTHKGCDKWAQKGEVYQKHGAKKKTCKERGVLRLFKAEDYVGCMEPQRRLVRGKGVPIMSSKKEEFVENMGESYRLIFAVISDVLSGYKRVDYVKVMGRRDRQKVKTLRSFDICAPLLRAYFTSTTPTLTKAFCLSPLPLCAIARSRRQLHLFLFSLVDFHP